MAANLKCFNCHQMGHRSVQCPKPQKENRCMSCKAVLGNTFCCPGCVIENRAGDRRCRVQVAPAYVRPWMRLDANDIGVFTVERARSCSEYLAEPRYDTISTWPPTAFVEDVEPEPPAPSVPAEANIEPIAEAEPQAGPSFIGRSEFRPRPGQAEMVPLLLEGIRRAWTVEQSLRMEFFGGHLDIRWTPSDQKPVPAPRYAAAVNAAARPSTTAAATGPNQSLDQRQRLLLAEIVKGIRAGRTLPAAEGNINGESPMEETTSDERSDASTDSSDGGEEYMDSRADTDDSADHSRINMFR